MTTTPEPHEGAQTGPTGSPSTRGVPDPDYGTPPAYGSMTEPLAVPAARASGGGLSKRTATFVTALSPFVALILFFVLMNQQVPQAWLAFLLVPITGLVTDQLRADKRSDR